MTQAGLPAIVRRDRATISINPTALSLASWKRAANSFAFKNRCIRLAICRPSSGKPMPIGKASLFTNIEGHPGWTACSQIVADRRKWAIGSVSMKRRSYRKSASGCASLSPRPPMPTGTGQGAEIYRRSSKPARSAGDAGIGSRQRALHPVGHHFRERPRHRDRQSLAASPADQRAGQDGVCHAAPPCARNLRRNIPSAAYRPRLRSSLASTRPSGSRPAIRPDPVSTS